MWRRESVPVWLGEKLVPEVHGRAPARGADCLSWGKGRGARGRDLWALGVKRMPLGRLRFGFWFCSA